MKNKITFILKIIVISLIFVVSILFYSRYIATMGLFVKEYRIEDKNIPQSFIGSKIVQFSDLHYGSTIFLDDLEKIVKRINDQKPDIIIFTGDLIEQNVILTQKEIKNITNVLSKLEANIEILTVKGNHDYENDYYDIIIKDLGWNNLDNTYEYVYNNGNTPIVFVGLDDLTNGIPDYKNAFSFLNEIEEDCYTIVLTHEPDSVMKFKNYHFDLVLSGHSHNGQVRLPFIGALYTPSGSKMYYDEFYEIDNYKMYISGGIGTSIVKMRLFNHPSFNLYRLYQNTK